MARCLGIPAISFEMSRRNGSCVTRLSETGRVRCNAGPEIDVAESVGAARAQAAFVVMRKKFGFVSGDVDADGAFALASLAGEAEIE